MKLYAEWRKGAGEGANITILQLHATADSEYKWLLLLIQWTTKNKSSELLGLQAKLTSLKHQFVAMLADHDKLKNKETKSSFKPTSDPKPEENEECIVNGVKWYHCTKYMLSHQWSKTHKTVSNNIKVLQLLPMLALVPTRIFSWLRLLIMPILSLLVTQVIIAYTILPCRPVPWSSRLPPISSSFCTIGSSKNGIKVYMGPWSVFGLNLEQFHMIQTHHLLFTVREARRH